MSFLRNKTRRMDRGVVGSSSFKGRRRLSGLGQESSVDLSTIPFSQLVNLLEQNAIAFKQFYETVNSIQNHIVSLDIKVLEATAPTLTPMQSVQQLSDDMNTYLNNIRVSMQQQNDVNLAVNITGARSTLEQLAASQPDVAQQFATSLNQMMEEVKTYTATPKTTTAYDVVSTMQPEGFSYLPSPVSPPSYASSPAGLPPIPQSVVNALATDAQRAYEAVVGLENLQYTAALQDDSEAVAQATESLSQWKVYVNKIMTARQAIPAAAVDTWKAMTGQLPDRAYEAISYFAGNYLGQYFKSDGELKPELKPPTPTPTPTTPIPYQPSTPEGTIVTVTGPGTPYMLPSENSPVPKGSSPPPGVSATGIFPVLDGAPTGRKLGMATWAQAGSEGYYPLYDSASGKLVAFVKRKSGGGWRRWWPLGALLGMIFSGGALSKILSGLSESERNSPAQLQDDGSIAVLNPDGTITRIPLSELLSRAGGAGGDADAQRRLADAMARAARGEDISQTGVSANRPFGLNVGATSIPLFAILLFLGVYGQGLLGGLWKPK